MKKHLFYTFLGVFIATAVLTLMGIAGAITIPKEYLTPLFAALILALTGSVVGLFKATDFFATPRTTPAYSKSKDIPKPEPNPTPSPDLSNKRKLEDIEAFAKFAQGQESALLSQISRTDLEHSFEVLLGAKSVNEFFDSLGRGKAYYERVEAIQKDKRLYEQIRSFLNQIRAMVGLDQWK
jgi:hypothetical protein